MKAARVYYKIFELVSLKQDDSQDIFGIKPCEHDLLNGDFKTEMEAIGNLNLLGQRHEPKQFTVLPVTIYVDHPHRDILSDDNSSNG